MAPEFELGTTSIIPDRRNDFNSSLNAKRNHFRISYLDFTHIFYGFFWTKIAVLNGCKLVETASPLNTRNGKLCGHHKIKICS